jgi:predicted nucleic acid-binding protein
MARYLIDSSILIDMLRDYAPAKRWLDSLDSANWAISIVTTAELLAGCRNKREQSAVVSELAQYRALWLTQSSQRQAIDWLVQHRLASGIGFLDCLIAATAAENSLVLATVNDKHFRIIKGLNVERPY